MAQQHVTTPLRKDLGSAKTAIPGTRGSVRRASGFVQIPITLKIPEKGEETAQGSEMSGYVNYHLLKALYGRCGGRYGTGLRLSLEGSGATAA